MDDTQGDWSPEPTFADVPPPQLGSEEIACQVGALVGIACDRDATQVIVTRPDGSEARVRARRGRAIYVADRPGIHTTDGLVITATAGDAS